MTESQTVARIRAAAAAALAAAETLLAEWLPEGKRQGSEWNARNPARGDQRAGSFGVSLVSGKWNDFADGDAHGGDLVSLLAYLRGGRQIDAAREIDQRLGLGLFSGTPGTAAVPAALNEDPHAKERREAEEAWRSSRRDEAARLAGEKWAAAGTVDTAHSYLIAKGVPPYGLRQLGGKLLVPLYHDGALVNVQQIDGQGRKRFLRGGRVSGCYTPIGRIKPGCRLFICEGWATGATLHDDTGEPVACAMNAGNLRYVALALRARYGDTVSLVIAGDDDRQTQGNPGRTAANAAAIEAGALLVFPTWPAGAPECLTDFNDLLLWMRGQLQEPA